MNDAVQLVKRMDDTLHEAMRQLRDISETNKSLILGITDMLKWLDKTGEYYERAIEAFVATRSESHDPKIQYEMDQLKKILGDPNG